MRKLDERASVAAAALMIALTAVPMSGEERTPPEPSDADAADDYAYWQQQLRRAGLPSQTSGSGSASMKTEATHAKGSAGAGVNRDRRRPANAGSAKRAPSPGPAAPSSPLPVLQASPPPLPSQSASPAAPPLRSGGPLAARPAGPQLVKFEPPPPPPPPPRPPQQAPTTTAPTIEVVLMPRPISIRRAAHVRWSGTRSHPAASVGSAVESMAQPDAWVAAVDGRSRGSKRRLEVRLTPRHLVVRRRVLGEGDDAPSREQPDVFWS